LAAIVGFAPAQAADKIEYAPPPKWVVPRPATAVEGETTGGAFRVVYNDVQTKIQGKTTDSYSAYRIKLLSPDALQLGNISLVWNPQSATETVHALRVYRDGEVIDVLKNSTFSIFQREGRLEQAMLDGLLTANLQIPGLRVGDEIEFAYMMSERDPVFSDTPFGMLYLAHKLAPGTYRLTLDWTGQPAPHINLSKDLEPFARRSDHGLEVVMHNPGTFVEPQGAPARYSIGRLLQFSDFDGWSGISKAFYPLFHEAADLDGIPGLQKRIAMIAQANPTPEARALEALRLVQNTVRYVFTAMDGGNFRPATASQTWDRRFGDCKGVTVLLLGILAELGVEAEPVLVSSSGGDGLDRFLPSPMLFDHVLVRAKVGGRQVWLDGTRTGDDRLMANADVPYRFVLPVTSTGATLEALPIVPPKLPNDLLFLDIDASAGVDKPARIASTHVMRGDVAIGLMIALRAMTEDAAAEAIKRNLNDGWIKPEKVSWKYDRDTAALSLTTVGPADLDWEYDDKARPGETAYLYLPQGGFSPPDKRERPADENQTLPYANDSSRFSCSVVRMRLPKMQGFSWAITARGIDRSLGGVAYYRLANLADNTIQMVRASRTEKAELSPAEAVVANGQIDDFDNSKAWVASVPVKAAGTGSQIAGKLPDLDAIDWLKETDICLPH
jgi:hypothetical protein